MRVTAALRLADKLHASALVRAGCPGTEPLLRTSVALCTVTEDERGQIGGKVSGYVAMESERTIIVCSVSVHNNALVSQA